MKPDNYVKVPDYFTQVGLKVERKPHELIYEADIISIIQNEDRFHQLIRQFGTYVKTVVIYYIETLQFSRNFLI